MWTASCMAKLPWSRYAILNASNSTVNLDDQVMELVSVQRASPVLPMQACDTLLLSIRAVSSRRLVVLPVGSHQIRNLMNSRQSCVAMRSHLSCFKTLCSCLVYYCLVVWSITAWWWLQAGKVLDAVLSFSASCLSMRQLH